MAYSVIGLREKKGLSLSQQSSEQITQRFTQYENNSYKANFLIRDSLITRSTWIWTIASLRVLSTALADSWLCPRVNIIKYLEDLVRSPAMTTQPALNRAFRNRLLDLVKADLVPKWIYDAIRPTGSQRPRMYGLPKTHKEGTPLRPILSITDLSHGDQCIP